MKTISINLNETIKVKLTDHGKDIFYHRFDKFNKEIGTEFIKPGYPMIDEDGYTEFQLWHFMSIYGRHIGMCLPNVIEPLEIVYDPHYKEIKNDQNEEDDEP